MIVRAISTTQFKLTRLKADGTPQSLGTIAGLGSLVYLSTVTASGATTVDIETTFDSTYDEYVIIANGITVSATVEIYGLMKIGGSYVTTGYLGHTSFPVSGANTYVGIGNRTTHFLITDDVGNTAGHNTNLVINIHNPSLTSLYKEVSFSGSSVTSAGLSKSISGSALNTGTSALTGIRIQPSSGTMSGTFRLYGIKKS